MKGKLIQVVSPSAKGVACLRHMEEEVSGDTLAQHFCDDEGRAVARQWLEWCPYSGRLVAVRGRYIEDMSVKYITENNIKQVMHIPAGLNTFPYRHPKAKDLVRYAELDLPQMIDFKKQTIKDLKNDGVISGDAVDVSYVSIDLLSDDFSKNFKSIDWNWEIPSIYVVEGISYYIPLDALKRIIDVFHETMTSGSVLIMDYFPDHVKSNEELNRVMESIPKSGGETCLTYLSKQDVSELLDKFNIISDHLESDLENEFYHDNISKPIGSIVVAEVK
jgi:methyltransferase (TIGR00027 family)